MARCEQDANACQTIAAVKAKRTRLLRRSLAQLQDVASGQVHLSLGTNAPFARLWFGITSNLVYIGETQIHGG